MRGVYGLSSGQVPRRVSRRGCAAAGEGVVASGPHRTVCPRRASVSLRHGRGVRPVGGAGGAGLARGGCVPMPVWWPSYPMPVRSAAMLPLLWRPTGGFVPAPRRCGSSPTVIIPNVSIGETISWWRTPRRSSAITTASAAARPIPCGRPAAGACLSSIFAKAPSFCNCPAAFRQRFCVCLPAVPRRRDRSSVSVRTRRGVRRGNRTSFPAEWHGCCREENRY